MQLTTPRLIIRDFRESDFNALRAIEAHPDTYFFEDFDPSEETTRLQLEKMLAHQNETSRKYYRLGITIPPQDVVMGRISLVLTNEAIREWEIGWANHPDEWGKGFAVEAARGMLGFAFEKLGAHRIIAISHAANKASIRVIEKLAMTREGHLRETRQWHDGWSDEVMYSILDHEWISN